MKQRLDTLAENNTAIFTLIKATPLRPDAAFTAEADKFRNYAAAWRGPLELGDGLFMAGAITRRRKFRFRKGFSCGG